MSESNKHKARTVEPKYRVSLRGGFSDRMGIKPENTTIQTDSLDLRTRTQIINTITDIIHQSRIFGSNSSHWNSFARGILKDVYQIEIDYSVDYDEYNLIPIITDTIRHDDYDSVLTIIEYLCREIPYHLKDHYQIFNRLFEREYVGYRFVSGLIVPISDEVEISEIDAALKESPDKVRTHFQKALVKLSDRNMPDYENSIKESISAVEAECCLLAGEKATLGEALNLLEKKRIVIHPSLKKAFSSLYGYTNDANGIRHAGDLDGKGSTFAEAKFMLVTCSAFVNYLLLCQAH